MCQVPFGDILTSKLVLKMRKYVCLFVLLRRLLLFIPGKYFIPPGKLLEYRLILIYAKHQFISRMCLLNDLTRFRGP